MRACALLSSVSMILTKVNLRIENKIQVFTWFIHTCFVQNTDRINMWKCLMSKRNLSINRKKYRGFGFKKNVFPPCKEPANFLTVSYRRHIKHIIKYKLSVYTMKDIQYADGDWEWFQIDVNQNRKIILPLDESVKSQIGLFPIRFTH